MDGFYFLIFLIAIVVVVIAFTKQRFDTATARDFSASAPVGTVRTYTYSGKSGSLSEPSTGMVMEDHITTMIANGWEIVHQSGMPGHMRLGQTLIGAALTGGLTLLAGGSRTADRVTITYRRLAPGATTKQVVQRL